MFLRVGLKDRELIHEFKFSIRLWRVPDICILEAVYIYAERVTFPWSVTFERVWLAEPKGTR